jgi:hypothetical protein
MKEIYKAEKVMVWLGGRDDLINKAIDAMPQLSTWLERSNGELVLEL